MAGWLERACCRTRGHQPFLGERNPQPSPDSWAGSASGITAFSEKLITNMNQPCFFLLSSAPELCRGVGRAPRGCTGSHTEGKHEASHFSLEPSRYLCLGIARGLCYLGAESPQHGRQEGELFQGPTDLFVSTQAGAHWAV